MVSIVLLPLVVYYVVIRYAIVMVYWLFRGMGMGSASVPLLSLLVAVYGLVCLPFELCSSREPLGRGAGRWGGEARLGQDIAKRTHCRASPDEDEATTSTHRSHRLQR